MADTLLPPFSKAPPARDTTGAMPSGRGGQPAEVDPVERVRILKRRFFATYHAPKWVKWRHEALGPAGDFAFHTGTGQWDPEQRRKLESQGRPVLTINRGRSVIETVVGYERSARLDAKPVAEVIGSTPPDERTIQTVEVFARLMKRVAVDQEVDAVRSEGFKDGVIGGLGAYYCGIDYLDDLANGRPELVRIPPGELLYDAACQDYDFENAREVFWHKLVPVEVLRATYRDHAEAIDAALDALPPDTPGATHELPSRDPFDGYRTTPEDSMLTLWDAETREVRVIECWFQAFEEVALVIDKARNTVEEIPDTDEARALVRALIAADPDTVKRVVVQRRRWEMSVFLPATDQEIATSIGGEHPFPNDTEHCPIVQFKAYEEGEEILGLWRNLKDPQREVNKRRSSLIDSVIKHGAIKWFARRGSLENPEFLEGAIDAGTVGWTRGNPGQDRPIEVAPPTLPEWVVTMEDRAARDIPDVSGVNIHLQGKAYASESGRKVAALQQQGQIQTSEIFDNYKRTTRLLWARLGKRIQQTHTNERVIGLESDAGDTEWITLNQKRVDEQGHVIVDRDLPALRWNMAITEAPTTPTARAAMQVALMEFVQAYPELKLAVADLIVEASDFPSRKELVQRVRQVQQAAGGGRPGTSGPAGGGAAPSSLQRGRPPTNGTVRIPRPDDAIVSQGLR